MVLAVEKRVTSPLIIPSSIEKIYEIDSKIGENFLDIGKSINCGEWFSSYYALPLKSVAQALVGFCNFIVKLRMKAVTDIFSIASLPNPSYPTIVKLFEV